MNTKGKDVCPQPECRPVLGLKDPLSSLAGFTDAGKKIAGSLKHSLHKNERISGSVENLFLKDEGPHFAPLCLPDGNRVQYAVSVLSVQKIPAFFCTGN
ncbi:hypothetical protein [Methanoregula sp.]|uniref:hypothetical protein n=1 Tax=Methanoregula sp. TaxID=2052170 RepID=UPI003BAEF56A